MKRFTILLVLAIIIISCNNPAEKEVTVTTSDTLIEEEQLDQKADSTSKQIDKMADSARKMMEKAADKNEKKD